SFSPSASPSIERKSGRKLFTSSGRFPGDNSVGSTPNCFFAKVLSDSRAVCGPTYTESRRCSRSMAVTSPMASSYQPFWRLGKFCAPNAARLLLAHEVAHRREHALVLKAAPVDSLTAATREQLVVPLQDLFGHAAARLVARDGLDRQVAEGAPRRE